MKKKAIEFSPELKKWAKISLEDKIGTILNLLENLNIKSLHRARHFSSGNKTKIITIGIFSPKK